MSLSTDQRKPLPAVDLDPSAKHRLNWRFRGACCNENPELFFPTGDTDPARRQLHEAKQVCHRCPVQELCLEWALELHQDHGVWGGLSAHERNNLNRRRKRSH